MAGGVIHHGDCRDVLPLPELVDAVVTDPPYGIGFMGKGWDKGVPGVEFWEAILGAMKPGAHLLAFGGTRTFHRLACAIEDAGFEIRDCLMWVYGTGFPKSHDVSKAIDKAAGAEREVVGQGAALCEFIRRGEPCPGHGDAGKRQSGATSNTPATVPATDAAKQWQGWGTALKPAWEPIILARKPLVGTVAANTLEHGTGGLNIDGCRVGTNGGTRKSGPPSYKPGTSLMGSLDGSLNGGGCEDIGKGRWPANLIHDGTDVVTQMFPDAERFFYCAKASAYDRGDGNTHPTVKPNDLMRYLCRMITPPGGSVLDPFMGSGSTLIAAEMEGFRPIGIDLDAEHCRIATGRLKGIQLGLSL